MALWYDIKIIRNRRDKSYFRVDTFAQNTSKNYTFIEREKVFDNEDAAKRYAYKMEAKVKAEGK